MRNDNNNVLYSSIVRISPPAGALSFGTLINPFSYQLSFEVLSDQNSIAEAEL